MTYNKGEYMRCNDISDWIVRYEHHVLIVENSASRIDSFFRRYYIPDSRYYDFSQICSDSATDRNDCAVSVVRDALNADEHVIIFNCVGWSDSGEGSAVSQFAMIARKFGKQLIVAVSKKDAPKIEPHLKTVGKLTGKDNIVVVSHARLEY